MHGAFHSYLVKLQLRALALRVAPLSAFAPLRGVHEVGILGVKLSSAQCAALRHLRVDGSSSHSENSRGTQPATVVSGGGHAESGVQDCPRIRIAQRRVVRLWRAAKLAGDPGLVAQHILALPKLLRRTVPSDVTFA